MPTVHCNGGKKNERITSMLSLNNVSVDGEPQHILDVLRVVESLDNETGKMIQATDWCWMYDYKMANRGPGGDAKL